ncbi:MAG: hypothetical protein V3R84_06765 [Acidimicrobiia bacterium]
MSRRVLTWVGIGVAVLAVALLWRGVWRYSDDLRAELLVPPTLPSPGVVEILEVGDAEVTLALTDVALLSGTWGLTTPTSYGRLGIVNGSDATTITRRYEPVEGTLSAGLASLDQVAFRGDPTRAFGLRYESVEVETELGPMPAWLMGGEGDVWVIYVHGAGGRAESLRWIRQPVDSGFPVLVITYRNDPGAPPSPDGLVSWGFDEWSDVEAAIEFALQGGATTVFLAGSGIGGSAVLTTLSETSHIRSINGAILDSAVLDLGAVEDARRPDGGLIGSWGRTLASFRFGVEWSRLDHSAAAESLKRPVLLLHGVRDEQTPVALADAFAAASSELVEYHRFDEAIQGATWNVSPRRFELLLRDFLVRHSPGAE